MTEENGIANTKNEETMDSTNSGIPLPEVSASHQRLQLQPFWPQASKNWFQLAELQFTLQGIKTDKQKFMHTLSALSTDTCETISDFLQDPPATNQYAQLKAILLDRLAPSNESQLEALLTGQQLGDRRPSEALRQIRTLAGTNFSEKLVRSIWIRKMPQIIKIALVAQPETIATDTLARTADRMYEVINSSQQTLSINPIETPPHRPALRAVPQHSRGRGTQPASSSLEDRMRQIESRLDGLFRSRSRSRGRQLHTQNHSSTPSRHPNPQGRCWYHARFGSNAHKCIPPCNFKKTQQVTFATDSKMEIDPKNTSTTG